MIRCFQQNQEPKSALLYFGRMRVVSAKPDRFTFPLVIRACTNLQDLCKGKHIHGQVLKYGLQFDVYIGTSLMELYCSFGDLKLAHRVFDEMPIKDTVAWTVILSGYLNNNGAIETAHQLFDKIPVKDIVAWNIMINGYMKLGNTKVAKMLFNQATAKDLLTYNTMLDGYAKCGEVEVMLEFFHKMPEKDVVSWNSVIGGLVQNKQINEAIKYFKKMQMDNLKANEVTLVTILSGCAQVGALDVGRWLHMYIKRSNIGLSDVIGTALVDMYSKCGDLCSAQWVFDKMLDRDVVTWNAMIMGFSMNGQSKEALEFFYQMKVEGVEPNEATMLGVLCACTHAGLVNEGRKWFYNMSKELGLTPKLKHYGCIVDLLGRAGLLNEAYRLIQTMPVEPHSGVWGALLGACKIHGNVELAEYALEKLIQLDVEDGGYLSIMSNIYANAGRWDDVARVRELMKKQRIAKLRGCSSIEINGEIHEFGVEEKVHPRRKEIVDMVYEISMRLRVSGHVASTSEVFFDVEEEEKETALYFHSEKMAVAFGLMATEKGTVIRIVKNLRICVDCHASIKLISKVFGREIVVRDRNRFHHFREGSCSCKDFW